MDVGDHSKIQAPGHEAVHVCRQCRWPFPNSHPSAKHRRAHKKVCGTIEGYKLVDSNDSDDESHSDEDFRIPSARLLERSINETGSGGTGDRSNRSEDEVFADAAAEFSDSSGFSPGLEEHFVDARKSASNMERVENDDSGSRQSDIIQPPSSETDGYQKKNHEVLDCKTDQLESALQYEDDIPTVVSLVSGNPAEESVLVLSNESYSPLRDSYPIKYEKTAYATSHESETKGGEIVTESLFEVLEQDNRCKGNPEVTLDNASQDILIEHSITQMIEVEPKLETKTVSTNEVSQSEEESTEELNHEMSTGDTYADVEPSNASIDIIQINSSAANATDSASSNYLGDGSNKIEGKESVHVFSVPEDVYVPHPEVMLEGFKGHGGLKIHQRLPSDSCERIEDKEANLRSTLSEENSPSFQLKHMSEDSVPVWEDKLDDESCKFTVKEVPFEGKVSLPEAVVSGEENSQSDVGVHAYDGTVEISSSHIVPYSKEEIPQEIFSNSLQKSFPDVATEVIPDDEDKLDDESCKFTVKEVPFDGKVSLPEAVVSVEENSQSDVGVRAYDGTVEINSSHIVPYSKEEIPHEIFSNSLQKSFPDVATEVVPDESFLEISMDAKVDEITNFVDMAEAGSYKKVTNEKLDMAETENSEGVSGVSGDGCIENTVKAPESPSNISDFQANSVVNSSKDYSAGSQEHCKNDIYDKSESQVAAVDATDGSNDKVSESGFLQMGTDLDSSRVVTDVSNIQESKEEKTNVSNIIQVECVDRVSVPSESHHSEEVQTLQKASEYHVVEEQVVSSLDSTSVEENGLGEIGGTTSRIGSETLQAEGDSNILTQRSAAAADISIDLGSQTDSLEAHWGSVSVLSAQSDVPTVIDAESFPSTDSLAPSGEAETAKLRKLKDEPRPGRSDVCEPPSFSTLAEGGQEVDGSNIQVQQSMPASSAQAGWFPSLTNVVNDSPGRKKNEEIIAKVTNWSSGKQHLPLKTLIGEASPETKPKSPIVQKDDTKSKGGQATTVNSILGTESPAVEATKEMGNEWNSPAKYPSEIKREKRKARPLWAPFVCCYSVN